MSDSGVTALILAAGQGKRMKSALPKVLHPMCGRPMLDFVVDAALDAGADDAVVVVGHERAQVEAHLKEAFGERVRTALQAEQRGTGHAAQCGLSAVTTARTALLLYGDTPLILSSDLQAMIAAQRGKALAMLVCELEDASGYGRILREDGAIVGVREHRDCNDEQRRIREVNPGMYVADVAFLRAALAQLEPNNDQNELYLTDIVALAATNGGVGGCSANRTTLVGVNDRAHLAAAEAEMYVRIADRWRRQGATVRSGACIDAGVLIEPDARIEHHVVLRGATTIATGARIDVGCVLDNVVVAEGAYLKPYSVCSDSRVGSGAQIGPFSHLRPQTDVGSEARVGNFVETKQTRLARGAKANHLAYLGNGEIGEGANIGAGTIFCNYDGFQKHTTIVGAGAFIGSDSQIVAPVTIGEGAYVATGTTVTKDVPKDGLAIARTRQSNKDGYAPRLRARLKAASKKKPV